MVKKIFLVLSITAMTGCASSPPEWLSNKDCTQIGCGKDLEFYPNERGAASRQARDWYGFEWGQTSSACQYDDKECIQTRREKEIAEGNTPWHWNNPNSN